MHEGNDGEGLQRLAPIALPIPGRLGIVLLSKTAHAVLPVHESQVGEGL